MWSVIANHIAEVKGISFNARNIKTITGGCINETYQIQDHNKSYFVKLNNLDSIDMFAAEADGLNEMAATKTIRVPSPICFGISNQKSYLVLEYIHLNNGNFKSQTNLGKDIAKLHSIGQKKFGWHRNNTIGTTMQLNPTNNNWPEFFRKYRLEFQINLAKKNGFEFHRSKELLNKTDDFFYGYKPKPTLLHGDLWSGNFAFDENKNPVVFDPANYYGDREAEFGLTEMFGGFSSDFWNGYNSVLPLDPGYSTRKELYRLYHTLNHLNLFGSSYAVSVQQLISQLNKTKLI